MDFQPYNPIFVQWLRNYRAMLGLDANCRYASWDEDDLPDTCPKCGERCELNDEPICYECEIDPSRGRECEAEEDEDETCEMCGGSGTIYVLRPSSWNGFFEVPTRCECTMPTLIPYNAVQEAIDALAGLNEV